MTMKNEIYKCETCGNILEVIHDGASSLTCCDQAMVKMTEQQGPVGREKHLPVVEAGSGSITVKIGEIPHPMDQDHFIEWVEFISGDQSEMLFLHPGSEPVVVFKTNKSEKDITVRAYCNVHGLWSR